MKKLLFILSAALIVASCGKSSKTTEQNSEAQSVAAKGKGNGKKPSALRITESLFNTQGLPIAGTFSVSRGPSEDTLTGIVTNWQGVWHHYAITHYKDLPENSRFTTINNMNYGAVSPNPVPSEWTILWPHDGTPTFYFFGVSSSGGVNVAGKTILAQ